MNRVSGSDGKQTPSTNGDGRGADGRFLKGWEGGPGNPWAKLTNALKVALAKSCEATDPTTKKARIEALTEELWTMALTPGGEDDKTRSAQRWAMQQILDRVLGKPKEHIELETTFTLAEAVKRLREARLVSSSN